MKITGLTRRVDSLGRIVIPKELRRMLHIKEGSPLEIYMDADETIVLKKYSQVGSLKNISQAYAQSLSKVTGAMVCVADRDEIIAAAGKELLRAVLRKIVGKALPIQAGFKAQSAHRPAMPRYGLEMSPDLHIIRARPGSR